MLFSFRDQEMEVTNNDLLTKAEGRIKEENLRKFERDCSDLLNAHTPADGEPLSDSQREQRRVAVAKLLIRTLCDWVPLYRKIKVKDSPTADELSEWFNKASRASKFGSLAIIYVRERARKMFGTTSKWVAIGFTAEEAACIEDVELQISLINRDEIQQMKELKNADTWNGPRARDIVRMNDQRRKDKIRVIEDHLQIAFLRFNDLNEEVKVSILTREDLTTAERQRTEKIALQDMQRSLVKEYREAVKEGKRFDLVKNSRLDQFEGF